MPNDRGECFAEALDRAIAADRQLAASVRELVVAAVDRWRHDGDEHLLALLASDEARPVVERYALAWPGRAPARDQFGPVRPAHYRAGGTC